MASSGESRSTVQSSAYVALTHDRPCSLQNKEREGLEMPAWILNKSGAYQCKKHGTGGMSVFQLPTLDDET